MSERLLAVVLVAALVSPIGASDWSPQDEVPSLRKHHKPGKNRDLERIRRRRDRTVTLLRLLQTPAKQVAFDDTPLEEALQWFKDQGLKNLVVRWKVLGRLGDIDKSTPITLSLQDVTFGEALDMVLSLISDQTQTPRDRLTYHVFDGMLKISTIADFDSRVYTRTYYVEDLLYPLTLNELLPFFQMGQQFAYVAELDPVVASGAAAQRPIVDVIDTGVLHGPGDPAYGRPDFAGARQEELDKLVALLKQVRPRSWDEGGGHGTITPFGDKLVITQTIELHEIIGGAFGKMRALKNQRRRSQ